MKRILFILMGLIPCLPQAMPCRAQSPVVELHMLSADKQEQPSVVELHWLSEAPMQEQGVSFGVPFAKGEVKADAQSYLSLNGQSMACEFSPTAYWEDGSVKWGGFHAVIPSKKASFINLVENQQQIVVNTGKAVYYFSKNGSALVDSIEMNKIKVCGAVELVSQQERRELSDNKAQILSTEAIYHVPYRNVIQKVSVEQQNSVRALIKIEGHHSNGTENCLPFVVRLYLYAGLAQAKMVHTFVYDLTTPFNRVDALGLRFSVPMREACYNRHVAFSTADGGVWSEPVQPLVGRSRLSPYLVSEERPSTKPSDQLSSNRRPMYPSWQQQQMEGKRIPEYNEFDERSRSLLDQWAAWGDFKLNQLNDKSFTIQKRTQPNSRWIGTYSSTRAGGCCFVGDVGGGMAVGLEDFWQSYPTSLEIRRARESEADMVVWLWSPDAEAMDLSHYDTIAHGLDAAYEDVQEGMSTPYGVARTHTLHWLPSAGYTGKESFAALSKSLTQDYPLMCSPEYLHQKRAFGVWSLPDSSTAFKASVEKRLQEYLDYYQQSVEEHCWYGCWNYGDVMHSYDAQRHEWMYDVGGYAWDNTELASNMWLWYSYLRSGNPDAWRMAVAMTRHTGEVDVYHMGDMAGLGSRHNVSHWGCGAKEARISQAAWNRFYYYLTTDERCGDLMDEVRDADQKLYTLDPMRLAQPRDQYPCTAPARLRIGPDWLAYAGNWMTAWERSGDTHYRDKIIAGMKSISALPHGIFSGPKALGYDPETGIITCQSDTSMQNTNHLLPIMGGFEIMNEMMEMISLPEWERTWLDFCVNYHEKAERISHNRFQIPRLPAYAAYRMQDEALSQEAWQRLLGKKDVLLPLSSKTLYPPFVPSSRVEIPYVNTNSVATWSLDAIYLLEVCP